jgi:hypothetical protein
MSHLSHHKCYVQENPEIAQYSTEEEGKEGQG